MSEQEWVDRDFYADLGVSSQASADEIKKAYRTLARENHPDAKPDDAHAEETFKRVSEAYSVLSDADKRKQYDQIRQMASAGPSAGSRQRSGPTGFASGGDGATGTAGLNLGDLFGFSPSGGMGTADAESLFDSLFGHTAGGRTGPTRGPDVEADMQLDLRTAARGGQLPLQMTDDVGTRTLQVRVPTGVSDGQRIRLHGRGQPGTGGGPAGDLYIRVHIAEDPVFERSGTNLLVHLPVTFPEAALGATVTAPTLEGSVSLRVPPNSSSGRTLRVRGRGLPTRGGNGDLLVTLQITMPDHLNTEARKAVEAYAQATDDHDPRAELSQRNNHAQTRA